MLPGKGHWFDRLCKPMNDHFNELVVCWTSIKADTCYCWYSQTRHLIYPPLKIIVFSVPKIKLFEVYYHNTVSFVFSDLFDVLLSRDDEEQMYGRE